MQRACQACGKAFTAARTTAKFCSDACRQRVHRGTVVPLADRTPRPAPLAPGRLQEATRTALEAAGLESTPPRLRSAAAGGVHRITRHAPRREGVPRA